MSIVETSLPNLWLKAIVFVLFGYMLLDKTFAYTFLGELAIAIGCLIFFVTSRRFMLLFSDPVLLLWTVFAFWGICRTVPYISEYGIQAPRDAVLWGYGLVAVLIAAFVEHSTQISRALNAYRKFLRWYLPLLPIMLVLSSLLSKSLPQIPWGSGVSILQLKPDDASVDVAVAAVFLLVFPNTRRRSRDQSLSLANMAGWAGLLAVVAMVLVISRGGTLAIACAIALISVFKTRQTVGKLVAIGTVSLILALAALLVLPSDIHIGRKKFNAETIVATLASVTGGSAQGTGHEGTAQWRLIWWQNIVRETVFGPFFWTGRGFGVNLAVADGPMNGATNEDAVALRSPHNGSMAILARMGVPGFLLWAALNGVFAFRLFMAQRRAATLGSRFWSSLHLWILASWLATFVDMSFDVYLEGPQGGIWFWSIIGLGIAAMRVQKKEARAIVASEQNHFDRTSRREFAGA